jgi:hypothetical protein
VKDKDIFKPLPLACESIQPAKIPDTIATVSNVNNGVYADAINDFIFAIYISYKLTPVCIAIDSSLQS